MASPTTEPARNSQRDVDEHRLADEDSADEAADTDAGAGSTTEPNPHDVQKEKEILAACKSRDIARLRSLAESGGGFLTDALRREAWPILLGVPLSTDRSSDGDGARDRDERLGSGKEKPAGTTTDVADPGGWKQLARHRDEDQVQLDVNRSFIYYPDNLSDAQLEERKSELSSLIIEVLRRHPYLCYFQGFHDICQVFLLVLAPAQRTPAVARLCALRIRDFMLPSLAPTTDQLRLLPDVLARADPALRAHLAGVEPFYALAGTLTMYAHNIEGYADIARLFDAFLAREPAFPVYMFAQIVLDRRDELFQFDEPDMLHVLLGRLPPKMDLDALVQRAAALLRRFPPASLRAWRAISPASVLKTASNVEACASQSMDQARDFFDAQAKEIRWVEAQDRVKAALWSYRRPAGAIGMAVAVGALAIYLRRNPTALHRILSFFPL